MDFSAYSFETKFYEVKIDFGKISLPCNVVPGTKLEIVSDRVVSKILYKALPKNFRLNLNLLDFTLLDFTLFQWQNEPFLVSE